ncbi:MAG: DUF2889 domain-containing protein [Pseudomonas sp.]
MHTRTLEMNGYQRDDGLWDIEGSLQDRKHDRWPSWESGTQPPRQPVHHLRVRLTLDDRFTVRAVDAALPAIPFPECRATVPPLQSLVGSTVSSGWRQAIQAALGGPAGCTHVRELLMALGTVAYQTLAGERRRKASAGEPSGGPPAPAPDHPLPHWGKCIAWRFDGEVLRRVAPAFRAPGR